MLISRSTQRLLPLRKLTRKNNAKRIVRTKKEERLVTIGQKEVTLDKILRLLQALASSYELAFFL